MGKELCQRWTFLFRMSRLSGSLWARLSRWLLLLAVVVVATGTRGVALGGLEPPPGPPPELPFPAVVPIVASERAGQVTGSSAVTPAGQYTQRFSIEVPPGRAGVQPGLALVYTSSAATNGHLGVGWSLEGMSAIRRCRKTRATEGFPAGIGFTNADSFCLDGQKMVRVGEEGEGEDGEGEDGESKSLEGAEFRLEQDTFSRIVAHGDSGLGPDKFTVQAKSGMVYDYATRVAPHRFEGGFSSAPVTDLGAQRMVWFLSKARDRAGNAMSFEHDVLEDPVTKGVETRLKAIAYTETPDGTPGKRRVEFHYTEDREDALFAYEFGVRWETRSLLEKITLHGPDGPDLSVTALLGEYRLTYTTSKDSGRSLLSSVTRCDAQGVCLRSKTFHWWERSAPGEPPLDFESVAVTPWDTASQNLPDAVVVADFTGDGLDDILYRVTYYDPDGYKPIYLVPAHRDNDGSITFGPEDPRARAMGSVSLRRSLALTRSRASLRYACSGACRSHKRDSLAVSFDARHRPRSLALVDRAWLENSRDEGSRARCSLFRTAKRGRRFERAWRAGERRAATGGPHFRKLHER